MVPKVAGSNPVIHPKLCPNRPLEIGTFLFIMNWLKIKTYTEISLAMVFWAASFIWYKEAYLYLGPMTLIFIRLIVSSVFLFSLMAILKRLEMVKTKDIPIFLLLALVEPLLYFLGESYGMQIVSSTVGSVIISTIPLFTPFAALIFYKEKISWYKMAGITISFFGVLLVIMGKGFQLIAPVEGIALMFLAVISAVCHSVIIAYLLPRYRILTIILGQSALGVLYFLPIFLLTEWELAKEINWSWTVIEPIIKLGVFPSSLSFIFYARTVRILGITRTNVFINFIPIFTAFMSFYLLNEEMSLGKIIGILVVISGLLFAQSEGLRKSTLNNSKNR